MTFYGSHQQLLMGDSMGPPQIVETALNRTEFGSVDGIWLGQSGVRRLPPAEVNLLDGIGNRRGFPSQKCPKRGRRRDMGTVCSVLRMWGFGQKWIVFAFLIDIPNRTGFDEDCPLSAAILVISDPSFQIVRVYSGMPRSFVSAAGGFGRSWSQVKLIYSVPLSDVLLILVTRKKVNL